MSNKSLVWLAAIGLAMQLAGCTSGEKSSDAGDAGGEVEALEGSSGSTDDALVSDSLPEESLGGDTAAHEALKPEDATAAAPAPAPGDELSLGDTAAPPPSMVTEPAPDTAANTIPAPAPDNMTPSEPAPPSAMETAPSTTDTTAMSAPPPSEEKPKPAPAPLQKMAMKPRKAGGTWFNGVYFARPGDTLKSISTLIYGENKTKLLKKGNPGYASREPKPGDKVYYNSPKRPTDSETMMTYFEETGMQPEVYSAKAGDNLRTIAKDLLGYDGAWKEVWSSNANLESKAALNEGDQFRYWKAAPIAMTPPPADTTVAGTTNAEIPTAPPTNAEATMPPPTQASNDLPPPPPMPDANQMPPPPDMNAAPPPPPPQAMNDLPPPPPPPPIEAAPPPPPPPPPIAKTKKAPAGEEEATAMNEDTMITLAMVAVAAAGVAALLVVRRRKKKKAELEAQIGESTHVG